MVINQREIVKKKLNKLKESTKPFPFIFLWEKNYNKEEFNVIWMLGYLCCPGNITGAHTMWSKADQGRLIFTRTHVGA